jgi:Bacterial lectin
MRRALTYTLTAAGVAAGALSAGPAAAAAPAPGGSGQLYQQSFADGSVPRGDWLSGGGACLTAGAARTASGIGACRTGSDPAGKGVLRLTGNNRDEAGYVLYTKPIAASHGLSISFDMYQYHATTRPGADGIGFILVDGAASPGTAGSPGGNLGYKGLAGGYLGVGFDEFGNFASRLLWGSGVSGKAPNSISIRGAQSAGYPLIRLINASRSLASDTARSRAVARHHVLITISTAGLITVQVSDGAKVVGRVAGLDLDKTPDQPKLPPTVKFAFTASTGWNTNVHEISRLVISPLPPDLHLAIKVSGTVQADGTARFVSTVSNDRTAGPTTGPVTVTEQIPAGLTPRAAAGDGWSCSIAGRQVTCTRPDLLAPKKAFPPITVTASAGARVPSRVTVSGTARTRGQTPPADGKANVTVPVLGPPDLSISLTPAGRFSVSGAGTYLLAVSNATRAAPAAGPVTVTFPVPAGQIPVSANGKGWTCAVSGQRVTCVNETTLRPGKRFQEIAVTVRMARLSVHPVAQVSTPGNAGLPARQSRPVTVPLMAAAVGLPGVPGAGFPAVCVGRGCGGQRGCCRVLPAVADPARHHVRPLPPRP